MKTTLQNDATCYAHRYSDLARAFCGSGAQRSPPDLSDCPAKRLDHHFRKVGAQQGLIWGCDIPSPPPRILQPPPPVMRPDSRHYRMMRPRRQNDAICYARRYSDLARAFCGSGAQRSPPDLSDCLPKRLDHHFKKVGEQQGLVWGCDPPSPPPRILEPPPPVMRTDPSSGHARMIRQKRRRIKSMQSMYKNTPTPNISFVIWMTERTGATWWRQKLNSHPNIVALNEFYHTWHKVRQQNIGSIGTQEGSTRQGLEEVLTGVDPVMHANIIHKRVQTKGAPVLAIGMKLKFLYCALKPLNSSEWCFSHPDYPAFNKSHVICSLRENALELAWSKMSQLVAAEKCRFSNVENLVHRACFDGLNWTVNPEELYRLTTKRAIQTQKLKAACETQARIGKTYFAWYENILMDPVEELSNVLKFLGVPSTSQALESNVRKANNVFLDARIPNWKDVASRFAGTEVAKYIKDALSISLEAKEKFNLMNQEALSRPLV